MNDTYTEYLKSLIRLKDAMLEQQDRRINMMIDYVFDKLPGADIRKLMRIAYLSLEEEHENHD